MVKKRVVQPGDVYWIDPNPTSGKEMKNRHRFIVITPKEINELGVSMTVPVTSGGEHARNMGLTVVISGYDTNGVAVCNQVRSFDISARVASGHASYIETLDEVIMNEIISRVVSIIDPVR
jgi:mRNA interferase ChpB